MLLVLHFLQQRGDAQQGNVDRRGVVSGPIPATRAAEPGACIKLFGVQSRRGIGMSWQAALRTRVRRASGVLPEQAQPTQMTLVVQRAPERSSDLRVIAPMHPPALDSPAPALRLERLEGFTCNQFCSPHARQEDQHVRRQVGQIVVSGLILAPAAGNFLPKDSRFPFRGFPPWVADRKSVTPGFQLSDLLFEPINVAARVGLSSIQAPSIQEQRGREPVP